jgi:hypothetical protein
LFALYNNRQLDSFWLLGGGFGAAGNVYFYQYTISRDAALELHITVHLEQANRIEVAVHSHSIVKVRRDY